MSSRTLAKPVVVIGSGAGGAAAAYAMSSAGLPVTLLEAGPRYNPTTDFRLDLPDWETHHFPHKVSPWTRQVIAQMQPIAPSNDELSSWNAGEGRMVSGPDRRKVGYWHVVGVGGSTLAFTGEAQRMNPASMSMRTRFDVAADWPIGYAELEPFYAEAERVMGATGDHASDPDRWRSTPYPLPAHEASYTSQFLGKATSKVGMSWTPNPNVSLSRPYDGRPQCNYCGQCTRGCPRLDKGTADLTFIRKAEATGLLDLRTRCEVVRLDSDPESGRIRRVVFVETVDGKRIAKSIEGAAYVIACGAVETPRLLLNSRGNGAPDGLGNESGQVGRNFMETVSWSSLGFAEEPLGSYRGLPSDRICWDFNRPDAIPGVIGGCRFSPTTHESDAVGPIAYATRLIAGWGREHRETVQQRFGNAVGIGSVGESLPNDRSFIGLHRRQRDAHGMPKAEIHSYVDEMTVARLKFMAAKCREVLQAAGVKELAEEYGTYDLFSSTHVFGTCRMGNDPDDSVVDRFGGSHRWKNLFVADASVFPSSGGGEGPMLTTAALALRTGRHIAERASRLEL